MYTLFRIGTVTPGILLSLYIGGIVLHNYPINAVLHNIMFYYDSSIGYSDSHFTALNILKLVALGSVIFLIGTVTSALYTMNAFSNTKLSNNTCRCIQVYTLYVYERWAVVVQVC